MGTSAWGRGRVTEGRGPALRLRNLHKRFADEEVVRALDVDVPWGSVVGVAGGAGSGRTTVASMASGLLPPDEGGVAILGVDAFGADAGDVRRAVGTLPDTTSSCDRRSVRDVLVDTGLMCGTDPEIAARRATLQLAECGLREIADLPLHSVPDEARTRVGLALALFRAPRVLVVDDPFAGTDAAAAAVVCAVLAGFAASGGAVLCLGDPQHVDASWCDRVVHLDGAPTRLRPSPRAAASAPLAACG